MIHSSHYDTARAVIAFLAVALMATVFIIFYQNQDTILASDVFYAFISLAIVGAGLLISLLYLSSKPQKLKSKKVVHKASHKTHKKK